jgi:hypothetical protein
MEIMGKVATYLMMEKDRRMDRSDGKTGKEA